MRAVSEGTNISGAGERSQDAGNEGLRRGIGEAVGVEDEETGNGGGRDTGGEKVGNEDARRDEVGGAAGVEGGAVVGGNVTGDVGGENGVSVRVRVLEEGKEGARDGRFLGVGGGEDEKRAFGGVVDEKEGCDEGVDGEAGGKDDNTAVGVIEKIGNYLLLKRKHPWVFYAGVRLFSCIISWEDIWFSPMGSGRKMEK